MRAPPAGSRPRTRLKGPVDPGAAGERVNERPGRLYLVGTPVGNLEDLSARAARVLGEVDLIAAEDTRRTRRLLAHLDLHTPLISYHQHSPAGRVDEILRRVEAGEDVAVVTDAGMPGISDPGWRLVAEAVSRGLTVVPVPGPSALTLALSASGLPTRSFVFDGFLPRRQGPRRRRLAELARLGVTVVVYESPHRAIETLGDVAEVLDDPEVVLCRELTKVHEEFIRGRAREVLEVLEARKSADGRLKGEMTLVIGVTSPSPGQPTPPAG
ncbi:MAG TPA: 16S rRNA (cytidine(1402)-2'-O)-methyltransferase [Clostridiales bacterium]|nr:16S rRNA (cytidine(1402)-2'-O)-methyltransferase [Clostridiales bacterium]